MKRYKKSNYNFFVNLENGNILLYNALYKSFVHFNSKHNNMIYKILEQPNSRNIINTESYEIYENLIKCKFLISEDFNELEWIKIKSNSVKYDSRFLTLTIAPTLGCNFKCPNCFENKKNIFFSPDTVNRIKLLIRRKITMEGTKKVYLNWYGGEPLLCKDAITEISNSIEVDYSATLYTNGYLLDENFIDQLKKLNIDNIRISIDGPKRIHNARRNINSTQTFDKIINNIEHIIAKYANKIRIIVQTVIDDIIYDSFEEMLKELQHLKGFISLTYSFSQNPELVNGSCSMKTCYESTISSNCLKKRKDSLYNLIIDYGFGKTTMPSSNYISCSAELLNSYAIDPSGDLYKCIMGIGTKINRIGTLNKDGKIITDFSELMKFLSFDVFHDDKCSECKYLPLCMGGCQLYNNSNLNTQNGNDKLCYDITRKLELEERLKKYLFPKGLVP